MLHAEESKFVSNQRCFHPFVSVQLPSFRFNERFYQRRSVINVVPEDESTKLMIIGRQCSFSHQFCSCFSYVNPKFVHFKETIDKSYFNFFFIILQLDGFCLVLCCESLFEISCCILDQAAKNSKNFTLVSSTSQNSCVLGCNNSISLLIAAMSRDFKKLKLFFIELTLNIPSSVFGNCTFLYKPSAL